MILNKKVSDVKIREILGIPKNTIQNMKNSDIDNWRFKVYTFIKSKSEEELSVFIDSLNTKEKQDAVLKER